MPKTSLISADSLLAVDIGSITTRAVLFDVVDGRYRFIAAGTSPSTVDSPFYDAGVGVRKAINFLEFITGRVIILDDGEMVLPSTPDGYGVDAFALSTSAGPPIKVVLVGLLDDVSVASVRHLAESTYTKIVEEIRLNDRRKQEDRIDAILRVRPHMILIAGGTDGGATASVNKLLEVVGLASYISPHGYRPEVLFAGNEELKDEAINSLESITNVYVAPNVRPVSDFEQLEPARQRMVEMFRKMRSYQILGLSEMNAWSGGQLLPTSTAFGRVVHFMSKFYGAKKGVLGVDVGASATTIAGAYAGELTLGVYPDLGLGQGAPSVLKTVSINDIAQWIPQQISAGDIRDYLFNKSVQPASLPATEEDLALEEALARAVLQGAVTKIRERLPKKLATGYNLLPYMDPILLAGSVFSNAPSPEHAMMMLLDGLQPVGVITALLDQNNIAASVGAAASYNSLLAVQVLESDAFLHLGTVIAPVGNAKPGVPVMRIRIKMEDGSETTEVIKFGSLVRLPIPLGMKVSLHIQPLQRFSIGTGPGRGGRLDVRGGVLGVIVDARGRPIQLHQNAENGREWLLRWKNSLAKK